jgi:lipoyl(octanoyl) transferase
MSTVFYKDLGVVSYEKALELQLEHFEYIKSIKTQNRNLKKNRLTPNYFFFVTHPHVYTMGKNGNMANILLNTKQLESKSISFYQTNRGGDITYHGPGQIVGYPILDLDNFSTDIHRYMRNLEEVIIKTIADYGIKGARSKGETGVWLDVGLQSARKICAMGVHTSRWVSMHGFALNANTDLSFFNGIVPCGIQNKGVTSLAKELNQKINEDQVKRKILNYFSEVFNTSMQINNDFNNKVSIKK